MNPNLKMVLLVLTMAVVTYLIRMSAFVIFKRKIKSQYVKSVLFYIPYGVLSAMTFPYILYSTGNFYTALIGTVVALITSVCFRSLLIVAGCAVAAVLIAGVIIL